MAGRLKLRAQNAEDLQVVAACLQDALVAVRDMAYLPQHKRFVMLLNRFRWEEDGRAGGDVPAEHTGDAPFAEEEGARFERVHCALRFERVRAVKSKGLHRPAGNQLVELLTISAEPKAIELVFAGEATVRIEVDALRCFLEDLGEPWPTAWRPGHPEWDPDTPAQ